MPKLQAMLTDRQIRQFYEEGYLILEGVIAAAELPHYREAFERMVAKVQANPLKEYGTRLLSEPNNRGDADREDTRTRETWGCNALMHPDLYEPAFTDFIDKQPLLTALSALLGSPLRVSGLKALWSSDRVDYDLIWHRDGPDTAHTPDGFQGHVQFNTALYQDASFRLVPGSHRRPLSDEEQTLSRKGTGPVGGAINPALQAGDSLLMHSHLFHRGAAPAGARRRTFHTIIASAHKPVYAQDIKKMRGWYDAVQPRLGPNAQALFDHFFAWEGRAIAAAD